MHIKKWKLSLGEIFRNKSIKNGIWLYLLQIFNTVVPLLTLPYITRILGTNQYGVFSIAVNIIMYYQVVVEYGFTMSATRKVALSDKQSHQLSEIFTRVVYSRCILLIICFIFTALYVLVNKAEQTQCVCIVILMITLLGNCLQLDWLFQGMQQMKYISIISIVARIISVVLTFLLVKSANDLYIYCILYSISPFISSILGMFFARKNFNIRMVSVTMHDIWEELKSGWYIFTTQLSSKVFGAIGITFLGIFATNSDVGIYAAIQKIPNIIMFAWIPITQVMYPMSSEKMQNSYEEGKKFVSRARRFFVPLFLSGAIVCAIFSRLMIQIAFGSEYAIKFYWIIPLLFWMVISINNNFSGIQTLLAGGYDKEYSKCFQIGVAITIFLNFILIYLFKGDGACWAPLLSELALGLLLKRQVKLLEKSKIKQ